MIPRLLLIFLVACAPPASNVCRKLAADKQTECMKALDAMKDRSSGEYGACSQCIVDSMSEPALARCRPYCAGMEELLPR